MIDPKALAATADKREMIRDGLFVVGTALLAAGVQMQFGWGWALIAVGAVMLGLVFAPVRG